MPIKDPEARRQYARDYRDRHLEKARATLLENKNKMRRYTHEYKEACGCSDCKVKYAYYVLDFDHRPGEIKLGSVGDMIKRLDWKLLHEEIAKCDVVCSNCHRERTYRRIVEGLEESDGVYASNGKAGPVLKTGSSQGPGSTPRYSEFGRFCCMGGDRPRKPE